MKKAYVSRRLCPVHIYLRIKKLPPSFGSKLSDRHKPCKYFLFIDKLKEER